jgi:hypothetical protein
VRHLNLFALFALFYFGLNPPASALRPISHYHDLVAGEGSAGFRDGNFASALFNSPAGMAFSANGKLLYVADENNNRIRIIHLDDNNRVETLAGSGEKGSLDGALLTASFNQPVGLVMLPDGNLLVNDRKNHLFRLVDLKKGQVITIAGNNQPNALTEGPADKVSLGWVWSMVFWPADTSVYFVSYDSQSVRKLDLKSGLISNILSADPQLPNPKAICLFQNQICVSNENQKQGGPDLVFQLEPTGNTLPGQAAVSVVQIGSGTSILALAGSEDRLLALQIGDVPVARVNPYQPLRLTSLWGFFLDHDNPFLLPFMDFQPNDTPGFLPDPQEPRKFYVAGAYTQSIIDFKDYDFESNDDSTSTSDELTDFNYPRAKPPHTYRIIVAGDSQVMGQNLVPITDVRKRMRIFSKRLEVLLNTQAALNELPVHFEVLTVAHLGDGDHSMFVWPYYEMPEIQKDYDADMGFIFVSSLSVNNYPTFFQFPLTSEGIPARNTDPEYRLKSISERSSNSLVKAFYNRCLRDGLVSPPSKGKDAQFPDSGVILQDPPAADLFLTMTGKALGMLNQKMAAAKTKEGRPARFFVCYAPGGGPHPAPEERYRVFWNDLCQQFGIPMMDLTEPFEALKPTYFPVYDNCCWNHFSAYGDELLAQILCHELLDTSWADDWKETLMDPKDVSTSPHPSNP